VSVPISAILGAAVHSRCPVAKHTQPTESGAARLRWPVFAPL